MGIIISGIASLILGIVLTYKYLSKKIEFQEQELKRYKFGIKSAYVKFGKTFEQYAPFTSKFTEEERSNFYFLGCPIDGIIFKEDEIQLVEIKTGNSLLSRKQENIKNLVQNGKVSFKEVRF